MQDKEELTLKKAILKTNVQVKSLYSELKKKLKRIPPQSYIPFCAKRLADCSRNLHEFRKTPPHDLLHSIEANCAYYNDGYSDTIDWDSFVKIMNLYRQYDDNQFLSYTIKENSDRFFLMMRRQQFALQKTATKSYMARVWSIFVNNHYTSKLADDFQRKYSFSYEQWFHLVFFLWAAANQNLERIFKREVLYHSDFYKVNAEIINSFYNQISITPENIKDNYFELRKDIESAYHFLIPSVFLEKPIIDFGNGYMLAPNPDLLFVYSGKGMLDLTSRIEGYDAYLAKSFEEHIFHVISCLDGIINIVDNQRLKDLTTGKSCDFLVETEKEIFLIECKATSFTAKMFTDNAILNNNSTGKIADALVQLYTTAYDLEQDVFESLNIDNNKTVIGIIITLGEIPLVNSEWYFNQFIMTRADTEKKLVEPIYPSNIMKKQPVSMAIETFENLITIMNNENLTFMELYNKKENEGIRKVGDWDSYMSNSLKRDYQLLPIILSNNEQFFKSMGIPELKEKSVD